MKRTFAAKVRDIFVRRTFVSMASPAGHLLVISEEKATRQQANSYV
jgi:hypothetical protein